MTATRRWSLIFVIGLLLVLNAALPAASAPCCIIVVPPPPPPPSPANGTAPPPHAQIYAQLPFFAAIQGGIFSPLNVKIVASPLNEGLGMVTSTQGALGVSPTNALAAFTEKTGANLQIAAVIINRPDYALFAPAGGARTVTALKNKQIAIPSVGSTAHLFAVAALRGAGLSEKDVKFVTFPPASNIVAALRIKEVDAAPIPIGGEVGQPNLNEIPLPKPVTLPFWVLYANTATLDKETREVAQLIKGLTEGIKIVKTDSELTRGILQQQFRITDRRMQSLILDKYIKVVLPDSIKPDPKEMEQTWDIMLSIGQIQKTPMLFDLRRVGQFF